MDIDRKVKKINKWLKHLGDFIDSDRRSQQANYNETKVALKKLKKHSRALRDELERKVLSAERRADLEQDLEIVKRQRQKGIAILRQIKEIEHMHE